MTITERLVANKEDIISLYESGESTVAIGKKYECSNASIYVFLRNCGVTLRVTNNKYDDLIPQALEKLSQGHSIQKVSKELNIPKSTLQRIAKKNNHDSTPNLKRCEISLEQFKDEIIFDYQEGKSQIDIADIYGCDPSNISRLLKKYNIKTRFHYECDHNFFDNIDKETKAYILGFFVADGYNRKDNIVSIKITDLEILEKIKKEIEYTGPIGVCCVNKKFPDRKPAYTLDICSSKISERLTNLGCPIRKTFITRFPTEEEVLNHLLVHYIRGVFDGNGSIYNTTNGWHVSIAGTASLLDGMREYIYEKTQIRFGIYPQGKIYVMKIGGNLQVKRFCEWMYKDSTIYLDRKYQLFNQLNE